MINRAIIVPANLVTFSFGIYTGWSATVTPQLKDAQTTPLDHAMTDEGISWACSWGIVGAILSTFCWSTLADKCGRKVTGFVTMAPYLVSWVILLAVKTETALMVSRFVGGLGASGLAINNPMYVGEISDASTKAGLGSLFILMYNFGVLYVYVFGVFVSYDLLNVAGLAVSVLFAAVWCFVPESPTYLVRRGRVDEARATLRWLRAKDSDKEVEEELNALCERGDGDGAAETRWRDLLDRSTIKALLIGFVFQAGTQFSGINIILMYTVEIFQHSGSTLSPEMCTMLVGVVQLVGSVVASCTVHKAGRKFFLMATYALTALSLITLGLCFYAKKIDQTLNTGLLPVLSLSVHVVAFSTGLGMVPYIIYSEVFPANVRNRCMAVLMFWNNVLGFSVVKAYPAMSNSMHKSGCFWLFGLVSLAIVPFTYFFVPETKDKTMDAVRRSLLLWFPDLQDQIRADAKDNGKVVVVESSDHKVYMEKDQNCYAEP